ncbi:MAG: hypothetical protein VX835_01400 [Pseudomonadota bacterium]|nr:hypothetical protein [Pseudomonadota bacterium]
MASLKHIWPKKTYVLYLCYFFCIGVYLSGCSSDTMVSERESENAVHYEAYAKDIDATQQAKLLKTIEQMPELNKSSIIIQVPSPQTQVASYERALWQTRANHLQQFLRMQGLSSNQIAVKECLSCTTIFVG